MCFCEFGVEYTMYKVQPIVPGVVYRITDFKQSGTVYYFPGGTIQIENGNWRVITEEKVELENGKMKLEGNYEKVTPGTICIPAARVLMC